MIVEAQHEYVAKRGVYEAEIRDYLLGRMAASPTTNALPPQAVNELPTIPILRWWIFEGMRYAGLEKCLAREWDRVHRKARRLHTTHNPHWRYVQAPEGDVDWVATAFVSATSGSPEYVCKTSKVGLTADEAAALEGWLIWVGREWAEYFAAYRPQGALEAVPWELRPASIPPSKRQLQRWAYVAKRSRWPLLRNVVAESLRCLFEPQLLDALPLPSDYATLFELLCIVRILKALDPSPTSLRWLDREATGNMIAMPGVKVSYERTVSKEHVLGGRPFDVWSAEGMERFKIRIPRSIDALFEFDEPRNGFAGILVEAKSGSQGPGAAVLQLLAYNNALKREGYGPLLVLAAAETDNGDPVPELETGPGHDLWMFLNVNDLTEQVGRQLGAKRAGS